MLAVDELLAVTFSICACVDMGCADGGGGGIGMV